MSRDAVDGLADLFLCGAAGSLAGLVLHPDWCTPPKLGIALLHAHIVVTLPGLNRVIEIFERNLAVSRLELVNILIVLDHVDLRDWRRAGNFHGELGRRRGFDDIAHERGSNPEIHDDV